MSCQYDTPLRASKEALRSENNELQAYRRLSEFIIGLLASGEKCDVILAELQNGKSLQQIAQDLIAHELAPESTPREHHKTPAEHGRVGEQSSAVGSAQQPERNISQNKGKDVVKDDGVYGGEPWTQVTTDAALIDHLMLLYFCWEYPIFASLSRRHFMTDFKSGRRRYCSSFLVNAILAVGYQFSSDSTRTSESTVSINDFSKEAERLMELEQDTPSLTTIQAMCILSILEASRGRSEESTFYCGQAIRMAVEMGLHLEVDLGPYSDVESEVRRATVWGVFALDQYVNESLAVMYTGG